MKTYDQIYLSLLVRTRKDFQKTRISLFNRLGMKADGSYQNVAERAFTPSDAETLHVLAKAAQEQEWFIVKQMKSVLKRFPVYEHWLQHQKGVGEIAASWILSEIDIHKAETVSKIVQFMGLNPGMVRGKKSVRKRNYKPEMGEIVGKLPPMKDGSERVAVLTDELIRGDKLTPGFLSPFNRPLKTAIVGVLSDGFIKAKAPYALEFYYPYKTRLENSDRMVNGKKWKDVSKGRRDRAAKRYMIKMFLQDLYVAWRGAENLPIREPYTEEYLGKEHQTPENEPDVERTPSRMSDESLSTTPQPS